MNRVPIDKIHCEVLPSEIAMLADGAKIYDSSCSPEARVYYIDKDDGYFLKISPRGTLAKEAEMTSYFHKKGIGAEVLHYSSRESDIMLSTRVRGEDCTHKDYLSDPKRLCDTLAGELRKLHEIDYTGCPVTDRTSNYLESVETNYLTGNYDKSHFPDSFGYSSAEEAYAVFVAHKNDFRADTLIHGDYCLPNVLLENWRLSGFIDLGCGGVGDRHIDIFWGTWTLWFNLKTDEYKNRFLDAYGRDKINEDMIKVVAAAEVFG